MSSWSWRLILVFTKWLIIEMFFRRNLLFTVFIWGNHRQLNIVSNVYSSLHIWIRNSILRQNFLQVRLTNIRQAAFKYCRPTEVTDGEFPCFISDNPHKIVILSTHTTHISGWRLENFVEMTILNILSLKIWPSSQ